MYCVCSLSWAVHTPGWLTFVPGLQAEEVEEEDTLLVSHLLRGRATKSLDTFPPLRLPTRPFFCQIPRFINTGAVSAVCGNAAGNKVVHLACWFAGGILTGPRNSMVLSFMAREACSSLLRKGAGDIFVLRQAPSFGSL